MPTYVYKFVESGETIEVQQSFSDDTLTELEHPESGTLMAVKKVFQPVGVTFKGSGFFKNDNRGTTSTTNASASESASDSGSSNSSATDASSATSSSSSDGATSSSSSTPSKSNGSTASTSSSSSAD